MFNNHSAHVTYSPSLGDNEFSKAVPVVDAPRDVRMESPSSLSVNLQQRELDGADAASQRIFTYIVSALNDQETSGKLNGVTYEDIQDNTSFGYSFVKNRMTEILEITDEIKVEPGSGRRPSRFFLLHQYLKRQEEEASDLTPSDGQSMEDGDYDDEQVAYKTVLASMKRERERLIKLLEEIQSDLRDRESAIRILEKDIKGH
jgi:hypothetical protein